MGDAFCYSSCVTPYFLSLRSPAQFRLQSCGHGNAGYALLLLTFISGNYMDGSPEDWFGRLAHAQGGEEFFGPWREDELFEYLLDEEPDLSVLEIRQRRFAEWQPIRELEEFPEAWLLEAERRHQEHRSFREMFLKFDADGSATLDRNELEQLMEALQFPFIMDEDEFKSLDTDDSGALDFKECLVYIEHVCPQVLNAPFWFYIDLQGEKEGPCPQYCFNFWIDGGHFNSSTLVRHEDFEKFLPLGDAKKFPDDWLRRASLDEQEDDAEADTDASGKTEQQVLDDDPTSKDWALEPYCIKIKESVLETLSENMNLRSELNISVTEEQQLQFRLFEAVTSFAAALEDDAKNSKKLSSFLFPCNFFILNSINTFHKPFTRQQLVARLERQFMGLQLRDKVEQDIAAWRGDEDLLDNGFGIAWCFSSKNALNLLNDMLPKGAEVRVIIARFNSLPAELDTWYRVDLDGGASTLPFSIKTWALAPTETVYRYLNRVGRSPRYRK